MSGERYLSQCWSWMLVELQWNTIDPCTKATFTQKETGLLIPFVVAIFGTKFLTNLCLVRQNSAQLRTPLLFAIKKFEFANIVFLVFSVTRWLILIKRGSSILVYHFFTACIAFLLYLDDITNAFWKKSGCVCTHSFWMRFCLSFLSFSFSPPLLFSIPSPKYQSYMPNPHFFKMHLRCHPGRAKMLCML